MSDQAAPLLVQVSSVDCYHSMLMFLLSTVQNQNPERRSLSLLCSKYTDKVVYPVLLVLRNALRNPCDIPDFLSRMSVGSSLM